MNKSMQFIVKFVDGIAKPHFFEKYVLPIKNNKYAVAVEIAAPTVPNGLIKRKFKMIFGTKAITLTQML